MASGDTINLGRPCKVCIDPGHGGFDSGGAGNGLVEKVENLKIALALAPILRAAGHTVILTREKDSGLGDNLSESLARRAQISVEHGSDLFVSIHHDDAESSTFRGCFGFCYSANPPNNPYPQGLDLARKMSTALHTDLGVPYAPYANPPAWAHWLRLGVFRYYDNAARVTCGLVECATLSSPQDATIVKAAGYHAKAALAIARGIHSHLGLGDPGEEPQPEPKWTLVGLDGVARPGPWMKEDGYGYCALRIAAEAAGVNVAFDGAKRQWTFSPKA